MSVKCLARYRWEELYFSHFLLTLFGSLRLPKPSSHGPCCLEGAREEKYDFAKLFDKFLSVAQLP